MKKIILFIAVLLPLIGLAQEEQKSVVVLDSVNHSYNTNLMVDIFTIYSSFKLHNNDSILEKGLILTRSGNGRIPLYGYFPSYDNGEIIERDTLFMPIFNSDFDTILWFDMIGGSVFAQSYIKIIPDNYIFSDSIATMTLTIVGLDKIQNKYEIKLYPTVVEDVINISSLSYPLKISVVNILGREQMKDVLYSDKQINCSKLKSGIYNCRIIDKDNIIQMIKFIKR